MIAKGRYVKGGATNSASAGGHLNSHLKYLEHRSRDDHESRADRSIFSKEDDADERRDAVNDGAAEDRETGQEVAVKLYPQDYQQLRESGHEHSEYEFYVQLETALEELERQDDV